MEGIEYSEDSCIVGKKGVGFDLLNLKVIIFGVRC